MPARRSGGTTGVLGGLLAGVLGGLVKRRLPSTPCLHAARTTTGRPDGAREANAGRRFRFRWTFRGSPCARSDLLRRKARRAAIARCPRRPTMAEEFPFRYIPPVDPNIGRRFGRYIVRMLLGRGGMGAAYLAEHEAQADVKCVIKF